MRADLALALHSLAASFRKDLSLFPVQQYMRLGHIMEVRSRPDHSVPQFAIHSDADMRFYPE